MWMLRIGMIIIYYPWDSNRRIVQQSIPPSFHCSPRRVRSSRLHIGLGTFIAVDAESNSPQINELGISASFDAIACVERLMHPTRAGSDLAALRDGRPDAPVSVHEWTFAVLELCQRLKRLSNDIFDPCLPSSLGSLEDLELRQPRIVVPHARLLLDLGGIAKGFAVDRALDALRTAGCSSGMVNAGGDLAAFGDTWREVLCRRSDGRTAVVNLRNAALATSDADNELRPAEHQGYYSGADRLGEVGRRRGAERLVRITGHATITAPTAAVADALTKCALAGDASSTAVLLAAFGARRIEFQER
jgi:thiamine biosynthesis lipoprotein